MRRAFIIAALLGAVLPATSIAQTVATYPYALAASSVQTGGVAVTVIPAHWMAQLSVCDIQNPPTASGPLYVDLVQTAAAGQSTSFVLGPGQSYRISGQVQTAVTAVAADAGHPIVGACY